MAGLIFSEILRALRESTIAAFASKKRYFRRTGLQRMTAWRRGRDSNPRDPFGPNGFQDRRFQPLTHPSASDYKLQRDSAKSLVGESASNVFRLRLPRVPSEEETIGAELSHKLRMRRKQVPCCLK